MYVFIVELGDVIGVEVTGETGERTPLLWVEGVMSLFCVAFGGDFGGDIGVESWILGVFGASLRK